MQEKRITVTIINPLGLHARPAAKIVERAKKYADCEVYLERDGDRVNGKSIMGIMMFAAEQGSLLDIVAIGSSADECLQDIDLLFKEGFDEMNPPGVPKT